MREREYNDLEKLGAPERNATTWKRERVDAAGGVGSLFIYIYTLSRRLPRAFCRSSESEFTIARRFQFGRRAPFVDSKIPNFTRLLWFSMCIGWCVLLNIFRNRPL